MCKFLKNYDLNGIFDSIIWDIYILQSILFNHTLLPFMSIKFQTSDPNRLLSSFKKAIEEHKVETWACDQDGDFTHTAEQWKNKAWLRAKIGSGELIFSMVCPKSSKITSVVYAIYHGRFIESMLTHCDSLFGSSVASAMPADGDKVSAE